MKRIVSVVLSMILVFASLGAFSLGASAATTDQTYAADALNSLELFLGTDLGYELDKNVTRAEGAVIAVRFLGKESDALANKAEHPFTDVPDWASAHVAYLYNAGFVVGISDTEYGSEMPMTFEHILTLALRILGYKDGTDFVWDAPFTLAKSKGIISAGADTSKGIATLRGNLVDIFWKMLSTQYKNGGYVCQKLMADGVFTSDEYSTAIMIREIGKESYEAWLNAPTVPSVPDEPDEPDVPDVPDVPDEPDEPDEPDVPDVPDVPDEPDVPDVPDVPDGEGSEDRNWTDNY